MKNFTSLIFATMLVATVSCNKSTTPITQEPTPTPPAEKTIEFVLPVMTGTDDYFQQQFEFDLNGNKISFKQSDMTEMTAKTDLEQISVLVRNAELALTSMFGVDHKETAQFFKYTLGKLNKGETVSAVSRTPIIKSERPSVEDVNFILGFGLLIDGKEGSISRVVNIKISNTDDALNQWFTLSNKDFKVLTYTYE